MCTHPREALELCRRFTERKLKQAGEVESWAASDAVRRTMKANRRRDTVPEIRIRRILHRMGYRYRVDFKPIAELNRRADIVFPREHLAVFIDGCFWHACPKHYKPPVANAPFWKAKAIQNRERDRQTARHLHNSGWHVVRVWEHDPPEKAVGRIIRKLDELREDLI